MSGQLESPHFFRDGDRVRASDGLIGEVTDSFALYAMIRWEDGKVVELEQFDADVVVIDRNPE